MNSTPEAETPENVLEKHFPCDMYHPDGDLRQNKIHDRDCKKCHYESQIIPAMEEYAQSLLAQKEEELKESVSCTDHMKEVCDNYQKELTKLEEEIEILKKSFSENVNTLEMLNKLMEMKEEEITKLKGAEAENMLLMLKVGHSIDKKDTEIYKLEEENRVLRNAVEENLIWIESMGITNDAVRRLRKSLTPTKTLTQWNK